MSYDNDLMRMEMLAKNVLHRIPPMPGKNRDALLEKAGLSSQIMDLFYDQTKQAKTEALETGVYRDDSPLADWDRRDYEQFATSILNLAEILGIPNTKMATEWRTARSQWSAINDTMNEKYPGARADEALYFQVLEAQGKEAATELLRISPTLSNYWRDKNHALLDAPLVLKYYKDPLKIDTIANSLSWEDVENKFGPQIFDLRRAQGEIPDNEWWTKREFRRQYPEVNESYDYQRDSLIRHTKGLSYLRDYVQTDKGAPDTVDFIVDGKPNEQQLQVLQFIEEMELEAREEVPLPEIPPEKWSPASKEFFRARDAAYAVGVEQFPNMPVLDDEYQRIKATYGNEAAKIFASEAGLYKMWDAVTLEEIKHPLTLREMDDKKLGFAAKALMRQEADKLWPGLMSLTEKEYYAIPRENKTERRRWRDEHPSYYAYLNWKDNALGHYKAVLTQQRDDLNAIDAEEIVKQLGF
jgi:hypothetical protein